MVRKVPDQEVGPPIQADRCGERGYTRRSFGHGIGLLLSNLGALESDTGRHLEALELHARAVALYRGSAARHATLRAREANVLLRPGRLDQAEASHLELLAWCRTHGLTVPENLALLDLGNVYYRSGRTHEARE